MPDPFSERVKHIIKQIPSGMVLTYGLVAVYAGNPRGARQVSRILHSVSKKDRLPWHRIINRHGRISLKPFSGYEIQKQLLQSEGVQFNAAEAVDLDQFLWRPDEACFDSVDPS